MVFQSNDTIPKTAVIGIFVDVVDGAGSLLRRKAASKSCYSSRPAVVPSRLLETVFASVGDISSPGSQTTTAPLILAEVVDLVRAGSFRSYRGSLTTPPCSEGVTWLVSTQRLAISASTFINARDVLGYNSRFVQNSPGQPNLMTLLASARGPQS